MKVINLRQFYLRINNIALFWLIVSNIIFSFFYDKNSLAIGNQPISFANKKQQKNTSEQDIVITSAKLIVEYKNGKAIFIENVQVNNENFNLNSDELSIEYELSDNKDSFMQFSNINNIIAKGNVYIKNIAANSSDNLNIKCNEASYDVKKNLVTLIGKIQLKQGEKEATGEKIIYDLKKKQITMLQADNDITQHNIKEKVKVKIPLKQQKLN